MSFLMGGDPEAELIGDIIFSHSDYLGFSSTGEMSGFPTVPPTQGKQQNSERIIQLA